MKKGIKQKLDNKETRLLFLILLLAFTIRVIFIIFVYWNEDKLGLYMYIDDLNYETYAKLYKSQSLNLIDLDIFNQLESDLGIIVAQLYFRWNAIIYYITNSGMILKLVNSLIGTLTIIPMYFFAKDLHNEKSALIASTIFALLPYHIMMSSFVFKDSLIVLLMAILLNMLIKYFKYDHLNIIFFIIISFSLRWLRTGLFEFFILFLIFIFIAKYISKYYKHRKFNMKIIPAAVFASVVIILIFINTNAFKYILKRFNIYLESGREYDGNISMIRIDNISEIYKLPLTFFFSTFFPINLNFRINEWYEIMGVLNFTLIPIGISYLLYLLDMSKMKIERIFLYPMIPLHILVIITVINIPRHYYFLHYYIIIFASIYLSKANSKTLKLVCIISVLVLFSMLVGKLVI